jgi:TRAP-type transport system periplasmic protein
MKSLIRLVSLCALMPSAVFHTAAHAQAPVIEWKLVTGYRAETFHTENISRFAQDVEKATAGQLRITLHPNNSLVKLNEIRAAVQEGKVEAGETIMTGLVKEIPIAGADSIPFVVSNYLDAMRLWKLQKPMIERDFAALGMKPLYAVPWPPQGLYSIKPIVSGRDFAGTKMRTYNQSTVRIAELLGAKPVEVPMVEVGKALASGQIDNMITSAVTGVENQVWTYVKNYYEINAWFPKNIVFVNKKAFDQLPKAAQTAVLEAGAAAESRGWTRSQAAALSSMTELRSRGMKVEPTPRDLDLELKRLGERFSREWIRSVGNDANAIFIPYYSQATIKK